MGVSLCSKCSLFNKKVMRWGQCQLQKGTFLLVLAMFGYWLRRLFEFIWFTFYPRGTFVTLLLKRPQTKFGIYDNTCSWVEFGAVSIINIFLSDIKLRQSNGIHLYWVSCLPHELQVICRVTNWIKREAHKKVSHTHTYIQSHIMQMHIKGVAYRVWHLCPNPTVPDCLRHVELDMGIVFKIHVGHRTGSKFLSCVPSSCRDSVV